MSKILESPIKALIVVGQEDISTRSRRKAFTRSAMRLVEDTYLAKAGSAKTAGAASLSASANFKKGVLR